MISIAASYALAFGGTAVTWAANADDAETYPDCRYEFFQAINAALRIATTGGWKSTLPTSSAASVRLSRLGDS